MATKAQLEAVKNTLLESNQPILASQHRDQVQSLINEMYDAQSRANILVGVQADTVQGASDTFLVFRSGQAFQLPVSLLNANDLASLGDVFITNLQDGDSLVYDAIADRWENRSILLGFALANLIDVSLTSLTGGDILRYDSVDDLWKNVSLASLLAPYALLTDLDAYQLLSQKGQANGYASLDSGAKVPLSQINDAILGQVSYQGTWNASTNTPTLVNPPAATTKGEYYVVSVGGSFAGLTFEVGDWIISNGTAWEKVNNTDAVRTVFGRLGDVVANAGDYAAFYVTIDTTQTITGAKTFSLDSIINGLNIGRGAGNIDTNTTVGLNALINNTTGNNNTSIGRAALRDNTTGNNNTAIGRSALREKTEGGGNTAIGVNAGRIIADGTTANAITANSVFIGFGTKALANDETNQIVIGYDAIGNGSNTATIGNASTISTHLFGNIHASKGGNNEAILSYSNTAVRTYTLQDASGTLALTSDLNAYLLLTGGTLTGALTGTTSNFTQDSIINGLNIGRGAGNIDTNTRVGFNALINNTTGINNTAIGRAALLSNTTGMGNTSIGRNALNSNTTGINNTAIGRDSLQANTTANNNTSIGSDSLRSNTTGSGNTAIGLNAGRFIADGTTANAITANSVFIGFGTKALANDETNQIVIGHNAIGNGSNSVTLGHTTITKTVLRGNVGIGTTTPNEILEVAGNIHVSGGNRTIFNRSNNALSIGTNNTERIRIQSDGTTFINKSPDADDFFNVQLGSDLSVNGDVKAEEFYSESITVTLPNNTTDFVTVKTFETTDKMIFQTATLPNDNTDGFHYAIFSKGYTGAASAFRRGNSFGANVALDVSGFTESILEAKATGTNMQGKTIIVKIMYLNK
jgi:hypothetical protein